MKTSNKILLATFFTVLLIMIGVHVALFAKYKKGDFTAIHDDMWPMNMVSQSLTGINYVSIDNVQNLTIQAADTSKLQYDKPGENDENVLSLTRKADTLFVTGKSDATNGRYYNSANLSIAGLLPVRLTNSRLNIRSSKTSQPLAIDISMADVFMEVNNYNESPLVFSSFRINADSSDINLFNTRIKSLDVTLRNSSLEETTLNADSIKINTDASSKIQLTGRNLAKAKITSHE